MIVICGVECLKTTLKIKIVYEKILKELGTLLLILIFALELFPCSLLKSLVRC